MNNWKSRLREADAAADASLPSDDAARMRQAVIAAARTAAAPRAPAWSRAFVVAATALVVTCASMLAALQRTTLSMPMALVELPGLPDAPALTAQSAFVERQQLHFETPGGTRIIWVFNAEFEDQGTLP